MPVHPSFSFTFRPLRVVIHLAKRVGFFNREVFIALFPFLGLHTILATSIAFMFPL